MQAGALGRNNDSRIKIGDTVYKQLVAIRLLTHFRPLSCLTHAHGVGKIIGNIFLALLSAFTLLECDPAYASGTIAKTGVTTYDTCYANGVNCSGWMSSADASCSAYISQYTGAYGAHLTINTYPPYPVPSGGQIGICYGTASGGGQISGSTNQYTELGCPANSTASGSSCTCDTGYAPDAAGKSCVGDSLPPPPPNCPYPLSAYGGGCACLSPNYMNNGVCTAPPNCPYPSVVNGASCACNSPNSVVNGVCTQPKSLSGQPIAPPPKSNGPCDCPKTPSTPSTGYPITISTGNKWLAETDVAIPLPGVAFQRYYNSRFPTDNANLGVGWTHTYARAVGVSGTTATVFRPEGRSYSFSNSSGNWVADADVKDRLYEFKDMMGARTGWRYFSARGEIETYNASGQLTSIVNHSFIEQWGVRQTLAYSDSSTSAAIASVPGLLIDVQDNFGRHLSFTYNSSNRIQTMTDSAGRVFTYAYSTDGNNNLISVTYPDNKVRQYLYNESANTGGTSLPNALTGIIDENGTRYMTYRYDWTGNAVEELSPAAGSNVNHNSLIYTIADPSGDPVSTTVTDPLGASRTYNFTTILGVPKSTGQTQPGGSGCSASASNLTYDANGNVASHSDFKGNKTCYAFDLTSNLEIVRLEGLPSGTACPADLAAYVPPAGSAIRKITTEWITMYRPRVIAEPLRKTTYAYDAVFNLSTRTIQPTTDSTGAAGLNATATGTPRIFSYPYYNSVGQVKTADGPRTDTTDTTNYAYDNHGNLTSVTNALNQVTTLGGYDANGHPGTITDPNGLVTSFTYDARGRLTSRSVGGETTTYTYDGVGNLTGVSLPGGAAYSYTYDAAHRLIQIADSQNNKLVYTLDAAGNRTREQLFDAAGNLSQTHSRVFDALSRLQSDIGAANQTTTYTYDANGNLTSITDPLNRQTSNVYDALNRLKQVTNPDAGVVRYGYDGLDQLTQVIDPRNLTTSYTRDGLGNLTQTASPDTGTTGLTYDAAGNVITRTDAKGQIASYTYDALNRLTSISYANAPAQTVTYQYDQGVNGIGHLTGITDSTGTTGYGYDQHGRLVTETKVSYGATYTTAYAYDTQGRLASITYPSGRVVNYSFDTLGRISGIETSFNGNDTEVLASNITYRPFGGVQSLLRANGKTYTRQYDQDGRIASYTLNGVPMAIGYDAASQIAFITDPQNLAATANYSYDPMSRLSGFTQGTANQNFGYDLDGNRTSQIVGATSTYYGYSTASNRLNSIQSGASAPQSVSHDLNGATTSDATRQYAYDVRGRLIQTTTAQGAVNYEVNALGLRVRKQVPYASTDTVYHYDAAGHLIGESPAGSTQFTREYIYLGDLPVAVMQ